MKDLAVFNAVALLKITDFKIKVFNCDDPDGINCKDTATVYIDVTGSGFQYITDLYAGKYKVPQEQFEILSDTSMRFIAAHPPTVIINNEVPRDTLMLNIPAGLKAVVPPTQVQWSGVATPFINTDVQFFYNADIIMQRVLFLLYDGPDESPFTETTKHSIKNIYPDKTVATTQLTNKLNDIANIISNNIEDYGYKTIELLIQDTKLSDGYFIATINVKLDNHTIGLTYGDKI